MSSLDYVLTFLLCASDGSACEIVSVRAVRFPSAESCTAAIPEVLSSSSRRRSDGRLIEARCQPLAVLCGGAVVLLSDRHLRWGAGQVSLPNPRPRPPVTWTVQASHILDPALTILCSGAPEPDCSGT